MLKLRLPKAGNEIQEENHQIFSNRFLAHNCLGYVFHKTIFKPCSGQCRQGLRGLAYPPPCFGHGVQRISITVGDDCWNVCYVILRAPQLPSKESKSTAGDSQTQASPEGTSPWNLIEASGSHGSVSHVFMLGDRPYGSFSRTHRYSLSPKNNLWTFQLCVQRSQLGLASRRK